MSDEGEKTILETEAIPCLENMADTVSRLAHDYNNFLAAIDGYAELIMREAASPALNIADASEIKKAGEKMAELNRKLLSFARRKTPSFFDTDLKELIETAKTVLEAKAPNNPLIFRLENTKTQLNPQQICEALYALTENAAQASLKGKPITISCKEADGKIFLTVKDEGEGMDKETLDKIFNPFFSTRNLPGLGLSCAYGIMMRHKAAIKISTAKNSGSEFNFIFGGSCG